MQVLKRLVKNPLSMVGLLLLLFFVGVAIAAPWLAPPQWKDDPYRIPRDGWGRQPAPPSEKHPFGLTEDKYDIYYGVVWGTRTAFRVGLIVVGLSAAIGIVIGSVSAYYGGLLDEFLMRFTDIFLSFPFLIVAVVFVARFGRSLEVVMIALILFRWMGYARLIRGGVLAVKQEEYVLAARAVGVSNLKILIRHILPNAIFPTLIQASMNLGSIVITAASLSFLGLGTPPGYADWGQMISFSRNWMLGEPGNVFKYWYTVAYPGAAIVLFVLAWNLIGDAFRDIMDPRIQA